MADPGSMETDMKSSVELGDEALWSGLDNNAMASLYQQLGMGTEQQLSSLGIEPSYSQGQLDLQSQPSFGNLLAHANSMSFSYSSLNGPRRGASFLARTLSSQSAGLGPAPVPEPDTQPVWNMPPSSDTEIQMGAEYLAPPGPPTAPVPQSFSTLVKEQAQQCPSEFLLDGTRMSAIELDQLSKASVSLQSLKELEQSCSPALDSIKRSQAQAIQAGDIASAKNIEAEQTTTAASLEGAVQELFTIIKTVVLDCFALQAARQLSQQFQLHQHLLEMYRQELHQTFGSGTPLAPHLVPPVVALYVAEQPLPQVVFKEKPIEESYTVSILTASQEDITVDRHMTAFLETGEIQIKAGSSTLTNHVVPIDWSGTDRKAKFDNLGVSISTRMTPITIRFQTVIQRGSFSAPVVTAPSFPFVVITNESQWYEAAGKLLLLDAFTGSKSIPWAQFANTLHSHFIKTTRQNQNERPLYHFELSYIHTRFFDNNENVTEKQGQNFWAWFGQIMQTIRFKRHISTMWNTGIIFGFMTKDECNRVLAGQGLGTFIIRFSESLPGLFGVAYVSDDPKERVKHCLIKNEDIGSNKSLAEFLRDKDQFQLLLRMDTLEVGKIRRIPKDVALQNFYSRKKVVANTSNPGYIVL